MSCLCMEGSKQTMVKWQRQKPDKCNNYTETVKLIYDCSTCELTIIRHVWMQYNYCSIKYRYWVTQQYIASRPYLMQINYLARVMEYLCTKLCLKPEKRKKGNTFSVVAHIFGFSSNNTCNYCQYYGLSIPLRVL